MASIENLFSRGWLDSSLEKRPTKAFIKDKHKGRSFFPLKRVYAYHVMWDMAKNQAHLAGLYAHDGVPIPGQDEDFESVQTNIMHIMASRILSPDTVLKLRDIGELQIVNTLTTGLKARYLGKVGTKLGKCEDEVDYVVEYLCMHLLQGRIQWPPKDNDGNDISGAPNYWGGITFDLPTGYAPQCIQNVTTLQGFGGHNGAQAVWSDWTNSKPRQDMMVIEEYIGETYGVDMEGARVIMSRTMLHDLCFNADMVAWIKGTDPGIKFVDANQLKGAVATLLGWNIETYDAKWTYESAGIGSEGGVTETQIRYMPRGRVLIVPQGAASSEEEAYFATAPDLGAPDGERLGQYTWNYSEPKPNWHTEVGTGIHGFPILKRSDDSGIFILNALS